MKPKHYVYSSKKRDDFLTIVNNQRDIPSDYVFMPKNIFFKVGSWLFNYGFAIPILWCISKVTNHTKVVNKRKVMKQLKHTGYIIYSNHVLMSDGFIPAVFNCWPRRTYIISLPETLMVNKPFQILLKMLGTVPLPGGFKSGMNFLKFLREKLDKNCAVAIYPEATIWPYYTGQRPIHEGSFKYPRMFDKPAVFSCTTFRKPTGLLKRFKKPKIVIYLSDAVYPCRNIVAKEDEKRIEKLYVQFIEKISNMKENYAVNDYVLDQRALEKFKENPRK